MARRAGGGGQWKTGLLVRVGCTALVLGLLAWHVERTNLVLGDRTLRISGMLAASPAQSTVVAAVEAVRDLTAPGETLAVVPDGSGLNFAARRQNPTPYDIMHPMVLAMYGEDRVAAAYAKAPPDYVLWLHQNTGGFGSSTFGETYAQQLAKQFADYERVRSFRGDVPIDLLRRKR